ASTALPEVRDAIDEVIGRLSGNVDPSLNNPDRTGGGFGFNYGRAKAPRGKSIEGGLDITDSTFGKSKVDATEAELFAGSTPAASVGDT
ncbi:hypothetical protein U2086_14760, partial [Listeria monocytogenes]|uniref:hypothetical protein n=1 Tax=Listeria monocytogenes TaxID=1639 RepID=UPI002FDC3267